MVCSLPCLDPDPVDDPSPPDGSIPLEPRISRPDLLTTIWTDPYWTQFSDKWKKRADAVMERQAKLHEDGVILPRAVDIQEISNAYHGVQECCDEYSMAKVAGERRKSRAFAKQLEERVGDLEFREGCSSMRTVRVAPTAGSVPPMEPIGAPTKANLQTSTKPGQSGISRDGEQEVKAMLVLTAVKHQNPVADKTRNTVITPVTTPGSSPGSSISAVNLKPNTYAEPDRPRLRSGNSA